MASAVIENLRAQAERRMPFLPRLLTGTFWNGTATIFNQGGTFVVTIIVARLLGKLSFGQYAMVQSTLMTVSGLAQLGVSYSATKHIAEFRSVDRVKTGRIVGLCSIVCPGLGILGALAIAVSAHILALHALNSPQLTLPLILGAAFVLFTATNSYQTGALVGLEQYRCLVSPGAISTAVTIVLVAAGSLVRGLNGAVAGVSAGAALRCLLHHRVLAQALKRLDIPVRYDHLRQEAYIFYDFAIPAAIAGYILMPSAWLANSLLVRQENGYAHMAAYSAAQTFRTAVMVLPYLMNSVGLSILNNVRRAAGSRAYKEVRKMNVLVFTALTGAVAAGFALCGRFLLAWFGKGYGEAAYPVLLILLASTVFEATFLALYQSVQASSRMWASLIAISIPWQAAFLFSSYHLIPRMGAVGLAWAYLMGIATALACTALLVRKIEFALPASAADAVIEMRDPAIAAETGITP